MSWLEDLAQNSDATFLAAFALGLLTAISPCPLATNISATAFISREVTNKQVVLLMGLSYTLGRTITYVALAAILYLGASTFAVAGLLQRYGERILGPLLILIGLVMLNVVKLNFLSRLNFGNDWSSRISTKNWLGALTLGLVFALAFCPYSGVLYFGILVPMTIRDDAGLVLPFLYALGTGIPVMLFSLLFAFGTSGIGKVFASVTKVERVVRTVSGAVFVLVGLYYIIIFLAPGG